MNIFMNVMAGMNLSQGIGTMAGGSYGCLEMAVVCDEVIGMAMRTLEGIVVDEKSLAFEVISEVGPGGHFLGHPHSVKFFKKEMFFPNLFDRQSEPLWAKAGGKRIEEIAREKVLHILSEHKPDPISDSAKSKMSRILKEATQEMVYS